MQISVLFPYWHGTQPMIRLTTPFCIVIHHCRKMLTCLWPPAHSFRWCSQLSVGHQHNSLSLYSWSSPEQQPWSGWSTDLQSSVSHLEMTSCLEAAGLMLPEGKDLFGRQVGALRCTEVLKPHKFKLDTVLCVITPLMHLLETVPILCQLMTR